MGKAEEEIHESDTKQIIIESYEKFIMIFKVQGKKLLSSPKNDLRSPTTSHYRDGYRSKDPPCFLTRD